MMKRLAVLLLVILATTLGVSSPASAAAHAWYTHCGFDHSAHDDPIVYPGLPGASHLHDFTGVKGIDAFSTPASKVDQPTTCQDAGETAGYWMPAFYVSGHKINPVEANVNYSAGGKDPATIQTIPFGLVMVAGGAGSGHIDWSCIPGNAYQINEDFIPCPDGSKTVARVDFPDCWNGTSLDSSDHRSHLAYSVVGVCPAGYPVPIPAVRMRYIYGIIPAGTVKLASGAPNTLHADFFNSWDPTRLEQLVNDCIRESVLQCTK